MKYIRTKDENNLIIDMTNMQLPYNVTDEYIDFNQFGMFKIVKQADTIEELCDEIVMRKDSKTIYGAIWTELGLRYVAKMNEKGELELI